MRDCYQYKLKSELREKNFFQLFFIDSNFSLEHDSYFSSEQTVLSCFFCTSKLIQMPFLIAN